MKDKEFFIFFDLDGTLIDTITDIHNALMVTLDKFGFSKFDIEVTKSYVGDGIKKLIKRAVTKENYTEEIENFFRKVYNKKIIENSKVYDGVYEVLSELKTVTEYLFVISNKSFKFTDYIVKHFSLNKYFKEWYGGDSFSEKKPSPIPIKEIFFKYQKNPDKSSFMIGDNYTDIESGYYAGVSTVFCSYGYGKIKDVKPDFTANKPYDILKIIHGRIFGK